MTFKFSSEFSACGRIYALGTLTDILLFLQFTTRTHKKREKRPRVRALCGTSNKVVVPGNNMSRRFSKKKGGDARSGVDTPLFVLLFAAMSAARA